MSLKLWTMASFTELKARRSQQETLRPGVQSNHKIHDAVRNLDRSGTADSPDKFKVDQLQQPEREVSTEFLSLQEYLPARIRIRWEKSKGRGIWSCEAFRPGKSCIPRAKCSVSDSLNPGQILFAETRTISCLSTRYLPTHCSACFLGSGDKVLKRCTSCKLVYYCDSVRFILVITITSTHKITGMSNTRLDLAQTWMFCFTELGQLGTQCLKRRWGNREVDTEWCDS